VAKAGLTLDSGALIAFEKRSARMLAIFKTALLDGAVMTVPTAVLAQVHRGNSPLIARMLQACELEDLTPALARRVGLLLAESRTSDIVDGAVVASAAPRGDRIITSDPGDIDRLLQAYASNHSCAVIPV
jgi:hypothetical protein